MALDAPFVLSDHDYSALEFRRVVTGMVGTHEDTLISPRPGVIAGMVGSMAGLTFTLGSGLALVSSNSDENGAYAVANSGPLTVTLDARDATYTRWDVIYLRIYDDTVDGLGENKVELEVASGTPAAAPQEPELPQGALPLWRAVVPPSVGQITVVDRRQRTVAPGGILPCTSSTRPTPMATQSGFAIWETDTKRMLVWNGTAWDRVIPEAPYGHVKYGGTGMAVQGAAKLVSWVSSPETLRGGMTWSSNGFVVPKTGLYSVTAGITLATGTAYSAGQYASARIYVNGTERVGGISTPGPGNTSYFTLDIAAPLLVQSGQRIQIYVQTHSAAPSRQIHANDTLTHFSAAFIGE